jgi:dipeptidyl aminopeptidase/acylaminoacyl peptidase
VVFCFTKPLMSLLARTTFFGEGNAWRLVPNYFGGYPWQPEVQKLLQRESPLSYVSEITTPYLIFHGDNDRRTGFVQSEMLYRSLKVLGRPVEYVRHPGGTHELTRSGNNRQRIDQMLRTYEFFERYISWPFFFHLLHQWFFA